MINCLIVDDEPLAQEVLVRYIAERKEMKLVGLCNNALAAFDLLHQHQVDLVFMDIKMPAIKGTDFIRSLKNPPHVIFTTAYSEYAVTGFELEAVDYLLKPITAERFHRSIDKLLKISPLEQREEKNYTYFKVSGKLVKIRHDELMYAQSVKDYISLKTVKGNFLTHMTMKYITGLLPEHIFIRVHRSYLVNRNYIEIVGRSTLNIGKEEIPIGDDFKKNVLQSKKTLL